MKSALLTTCSEEDKWDLYLEQIQFAINNVQSKATGRSASELLHGFRPRTGPDAELIDEVGQLPKLIEDIVSVREQVGQQLEAQAARQKLHFDKKRKKPRNYKEGDLVVILKQDTSVVGSKKMTKPYDGPMVVKKVLDNDRYVVSDMSGSYRTRNKSSYENIVAVDRMKPWQIPGGVSDESDEGSGSDGVPLSEDSEEES